MSHFNSVLTEVRGPSGLDTYRRETGQGPVLWSGRASAYLTRVRRFESDGTVGQVVEVDVLILPRRAAAQITVTPGALTAGQTVLVEQRRGNRTTRTRWRVRGEDRREVESIADSVRIQLVEPREEA